MEEAERNGVYQTYRSAPNIIKTAARLIEQVENTGPNPSRISRITNTARRYLANTPYPNGTLIPTTWQDYYEKRQKDKNATKASKGSSNGQEDSRVKRKKSYNDIRRQWDRIWGDSVRNSDVYKALVKRRRGETTFAFSDADEVLKRGRNLSEKDRIINNRINRASKITGKYLDNLRSASGFSDMTPYSGSDERRKKYWEFQDKKFSYARRAGISGQEDRRVRRRKTKSQIENQLSRIQKEVKRRVQARKDEENRTPRVGDRYRYTHRSTYPYQLSGRTFWRNFERNVTATVTGENLPDSWTGERRFDIEYDVNDPNHGGWGTWSPSVTKRELRSLNAEQNQYLNEQDERRAEGAQNAAKKMLASVSG